MNPWYEKTPRAWKFDPGPPARDLSVLQGTTFLMNQREFMAHSKNGTAKLHTYVDFPVNFNLLGNKDEHKGQRCRDPDDHYNVPHVADPRIKQCIIRYRFNKLTVESLPEEDKKLHFKSCAIVGNSGKLLMSKLGREIDSHDAVIRINGAPTEGFEADVGRKTTLDLCNHFNMQRMAKHHAQGLKQKYNGTASKLVVFESVRYRAYYTLIPKVLNAIGKERLLVLSPGYVQKVLDIWWTLLEEHTKEIDHDYGIVRRGDGTCAKHKDGTFGHSKTTRDAVEGAAGEATCGRPLSGWFATVLAADVCDEVHIYGFDSYKKKKGQTEGHAPYHYFDEVVGHTQTHNFDLAEKITEQFLTNTGKKFEMVEVRDLEVEEEEFAEKAGGGDPPGGAAGA